MSAPIAQPTAGANQACATETIYYDEDGNAQVQVALEEPTNFLIYSTCGLMARVCPGGGLKVVGNGNDRCIALDICTDIDEFTSGTINPNLPDITPANSPVNLGGPGPEDAITTVCMVNCCGTPMAITEHYNAIFDLLIGPGGVGAQFTVAVQRRCATGSTIGAATGAMGAAAWGQFSNFVAENIPEALTPNTYTTPGLSRSDTVTIPPNTVRCCQYRINHAVQDGATRVVRYNQNVVHMGVGQGASC